MGVKLEVRGYKPKGCKKRGGGGGFVVISMVLV